MVLLTDRKLFANSFLFGMTLWCFLLTGNYLLKVSYSAWHYCLSCRQETICELFPIRLGTTAFHTNRKLFANCFLPGMTLWYSLPTGNYLRIVSYPAWHYGIPYRQETICELFLIRLGTTAFLADRKLFANSFLFGMTLWCFLPTGNYLLKVSCPA